VIDTAWWSRLPTEACAEVFDEQERTLPVGRIGQVEDVGYAVQLLMKNSFVTGVVFECDGELRLLGWKPGAAVGAGSSAQLAFCGT
jgi:NAD(P)-dependent dehydrogenase (short-subunit alcohol dehydrogenase family)